MRYGTGCLSGLNLACGTIYSVYVKELNEQIQCIYKNSEQHACIVPCERLTFRCKSVNYLLLGAIPAAF